jgi:predicted polyphosphate/ATP-dependent NAD kinase
MTTHTANALCLGLIINPLAGVGGPSGLKGSDDTALVRQALEQGADFRADQRASRCLQILQQRFGPLLEVTTCQGVMGERACQAAGITSVALLDIGAEKALDCRSEDTRAAAAQLRDQVDLLLFVGGDGTARDICAEVHEQLPVLGIPSGVKMHSGVFAISPEGAAEVVAAMMSGELVDLREQEVRDIDEAAFREGQVRSVYYGDMLVPQCGHFVQATKQGGREVEELVLDDMAAFLREQMDPDTLYLVGAGTTPRALMNELGLDNSLLGIDAVLDEQLLASDLTGPELEALVAQHRGDVVAVLSITGGQGSLIGRGNQQLTPTVLRRIGRDHLWILATKSKIRELDGRPLLLDSNDLEIDRGWSGYLPVITGYQDQILYPVGTHFEHQDEPEHKV